MKSVFFKILLGVSPLLFAQFLWTAPNAADAFVYGFEDLPLMEPLSQVAGSSVLFDTPQGRIVQATATGPVDRDSVLRFYRTTLPQLGWTMMGDAEFRREGEILKLEFFERDTNLEVRFLIEPHS